MNEKQVSKMKVVVVALLAVVTLGSGVPRPSSRIVGGNEATPHSIPYQAFLIMYMKNNNGWPCTGALISPTYVVTIGSCVISSTPSVAVRAEVILGAYNRSYEESTQVRLKSSEIKVHEKFNYTKPDYDIAIIKLPESVCFTRAITPINLPSVGDANNCNNNYISALAITSGWGRTGNGPSTSNLLNFVQVRVITNEECEAIYGTLPNSIICTSGEGGGACTGDYGAPLITDGVLIGLASRVPGCDVKNPTQYTGITDFLDWLAENTDAKFA